MLTKTELNQFKRLLLHLRARMRGDVEQLTDEALEGSRANGTSKSPTHNAELGTQNYEQDFALRVVENNQEVLEEIESALGRLKQGTFGLCENCRSEGKARSRSKILKTRLKAIPYARNCVACEREREEQAL